MSQLKVIIVDDEAAARNVLSSLIQMSKFDIEIVATCCDVAEAVESIKRSKPDLVFLDVQMPDYAGYEIVNFFDEINFEIVFVTAYDQYAIKAFELNAVDYVVKPIERNRLKEAIEKVQSKLDQKNRIEQYKRLLDSMKGEVLGNIAISELSDGEVSKRVLKLKDIIAIEANGAYCNVHLMNEAPFLVSRNLKYFESLLPKDSAFFRSHRSWILNLEHVLKFKPRFGDVNMKQNLVAKVAKNRIEAFEELTLA